MTQKLKNLRRAIKAAEKFRAEVKRREKQQREREESSERKFWQKENKWLGEKLKLSKAIFQWCEKFVRSEEYQKLLEIIEYDRPWIYAGEWENGEEWERRPFRIYPEKNGALTYSRWLQSCVKSGYVDQFTLENPEELALNLTKRHLEEFHRFITTGQVYESLCEQVKEAKELAKEDAEELGLAEEDEDEED